MDYDYDVRSCTVEELLAGSSPPFLVPEFQRPYSWTPADVEALFEDVLDAGHTWGREPTRYFLGAIVLVPKDRSLLVIDGQQRLATVSMVLAALREYMTRNGLARDAEVLSQALTTKQLGQEARARLELQPEDAAAYRQVIDSPASIDDGARSLHKVHRAALAIRAALTSRIGRGGGDPKADVEGIAKRFFSGIELVRIGAPDEGSAYRLFEALNDRGRALSAADLIKNKIFAGAEVNLAPVRASWQELQRHVHDDELLGYLRHFWIAFRGPARRNELYDAYEAEVSKSAPMQVAALARDLADSARIYRDIASPKKIERQSVLESSTERLARLERLRAKSGRPLLLLFAKRWPAALPLVATMIETASIRHGLVCQRNPNQLDATYTAICQSLRDLEPSATADAALGICVEQLGRWMPENEDFQAALVSARVRSNLTGWRVLLVAIEESLGSEELRVSGSSDVHVEHVLPQSPSAACLRECGIAESALGDLNFRLGNLTLLSGKKNISASNAAFSIKRKILKQSDIKMNRAIAAKARWRAQEIEERSLLLAEIAGRLWPWPPAIAEVRKRGRVGSAKANSKGADAAQLTLLDEVAVQEEGRLDPNLKWRGTLWIPRILWALRKAEERGLGPLSPSEVARMLEEELERTIQSTNTARAFRQIPEESPESSAWWNVHDGRYSLTAKGKAAIAAIESGRDPSKDKETQRLRGEPSSQLSSKIRARRA